MANEKFYLDFKGNIGKLYIDEPINFNTISFDLNQKKKGYGRDVFFNGGEIELEFNKWNNHELDNLLYFNHLYGFEAKVQLGIEFPNATEIVMDLDFKSANTDDLEYFKCKCLEVSEVKIVDRRSSTKVNLFSDKDIDGNAIAPAQKYGIIIKPKETIQKSKTEQLSQFSNSWEATNGGFKKGTKVVYVNPCANRNQFDIRDTYTFFANESSDRNDFQVLKPANNLKNITIKVNGKFTLDSFYSANGYVNFDMIAAYGDDIKTAKEIILYHWEQNDTNNDVIIHDTANEGQMDCTISNISRGSGLWIYLKVYIRKSEDFLGDVSAMVTIENMTTELKATDVPYSTTVEGIRLFDAMKQVSKSISGLDVTAPRYDVGGIHYNNFIFNGNLLRKKDVQFRISLDDISSGLNEHNADYEVGNTIFFGHESDFYTPNEIWFFDDIQFHSFSKKTNERFAINEFAFKYKTFKAQKENEAENTIDTIHAEGILTLFNKNVENKREVSVDWIRDSFLINEVTQETNSISTTTSTQNDDEIFVLNVVDSQVNNVFFESDIFYHEYWIDEFDNKGIYLKSSGTPNFVSLGLKTGIFEILAPDKNAGLYTYNTSEVKNNSIKLHSSSANPNQNNDGERLTRIRYVLKGVDYPYTSRTIEEITNIGNLISSKTYSNLIYSVKRNIQRDYSEYLSTCNLFWKNNPITVTWYKNNRDATFTYNGITTKEGDDYLPTNPILSTNVYENVIFQNVELEDFFAIKEAIKTTRGFIRMIDKNGVVIKLYPMEMAYENMARQLKIKGEQKYEPNNMTIDKNAEGVIIINNETNIMKLLYEVIDHKLYIYDTNRYRLYNPVYWDKVSVNGGYARNENDLKRLLSLL